MPEPNAQEEIQQLAALRRDVDRILILVDGDDSLGIVGLRQRMDAMEDLAEEIKGFRSTLRGISIGLGITGVSSVGALAAIIAKLF